MTVFRLLPNVQRRPEKEVRTDRNPAEPRTVLTLRSYYWKHKYSPNREGGIWFVFLFSVLCAFVNKVHVITDISFYIKDYIVIDGLLFSQ